MSKIYDEVLSANAGYAGLFGDRGSLALPPARRFAILTCMDARLDPARYAGLAEGDAHVIRNAGGQATDDAIRSLVISHKLLGTLEWFVIHHTTAAWSSSPTRSSPISSRTISGTRVVRRQGLDQPASPWRPCRRPFRPTAHDRGASAERAAGRPAHPRASARVPVHPPDLWLRPSTTCARASSTR